MGWVTSRALLPADAEAQVEKAAVDRSVLRPFKPWSLLGPRLALIRLVKLVIGSPLGDRRGQEGTDAASHAAARGKHR